MKNLSVFLSIAIILSLANISFARGGGGCFLPGTSVSTPSGSVPIENISLNQSVLSFDQNGISNSSVLDVYQVERDYYYSINTNLGQVNVTAEHPFFVGNNQYVEAQDLTIGQIIYYNLNNSLIPIRIISINQINHSTVAYNLQVDNTHTFFANGFAVHNKGGGGGGGCFVGGTEVFTPNGDQKISDLSVGSIVYSFNQNHSLVESKVQDIYSFERSEYYTIVTDLSSVNVTSEHPFFNGQNYTEAQNLHPGNIIYLIKGGVLVPQIIRSKVVVYSPTLVYNLHVDGPNTFFANNYAVHNKGGGGFSGGSSHSSSPPSNLFYYDCNDFSKNQCCAITSSTYVAPSAVLNSLNSQYSCKCRVSGTNTWEVSTSFTSRYDQCDCTNSQSFSVFPVPACFNYVSSCVCPISFIFFFIIMGRVFNSISYKFKSSSSSFSSGSWSSTTSISLSAIYSKSKGVSSLLSQWSKSDQMWLEEKIKATAKTTFLKLQECWGKRDYSEMVPLMQTSLYNQHVAQLESMKLKHEINRLDGLELLDLQVVLVKNYHDKKKDEFVVWLKATARDTIIDDRTNQMIRGDSAKGTFEEFWSFRSDNDSWKLYLITQPEEGMNIIKAENFDSISTAGMVERQEQKTGGKKASTINVASIREQEVETANAPIDKIKWKAGRVSRLLNFLSDKDKSWNEDDLKSLVRTMFISLNTSIEACDISRIKPQLDPVFAAKTELTVSDYKSKNQRLEMRNLAVRDVEIVLVRNYYDNRKDEFVAWVSGQAQGVLVDSKSSSAISGDSFVKDFESFWTFKRSGDAWLLSNVEKGFAAPAYADEENFDEGSDKQLLEWYYTKDRAM